MAQPDTVGTLQPGRHRRWHGGTRLGRRCRSGFGAKVAIVERHALGGDCLNYGCVPSKALIRAARAIAEARVTVRIGLVTGSVRPDSAPPWRVFVGCGPTSRETDSVARLAISASTSLRAGALSRPTPSITRHASPIASAIVATGARAVPPILALQEASSIRTVDLLLTELPVRLVVTGAGPIYGLAQAFRRFGS